MTGAAPPGLGKPTAVLGSWVRVSVSEERLRKGVVDCVLTEGLEACTLTGETKPHARLCALSW